MKFLHTLQSTGCLFSKKRNLWALLFAIALPLGTFAQRTITGTVTEEGSNEPLVGVTVSVKGTSKGTVTELDGTFSLKLSQNDKTIVFSAVGYLTREVEVSVSDIIDIAMRQDIIGLSEVTVTALGISREKKALGYAVQDIGGDALDKARETNFAAGLAGKIAGVQVVGNPSGIGSSARVTIRGERSLNINNNQPLFVVDGVPISNNIVGSSGRSNQEVDYGNGAGMINPDDVESVTVLKGASAAALYGSRANNGVILIRTKTGKGKKGIGVSFNSSLTFEDPLRLPDYQNVYGQGLNGEFEFKDGNGGGVRDGVDESWGPKMEGQLIKQFDSPTSKGFRGADVGNLSTRIGPVNLTAQLNARGDIQATPFLAQPDNIRDFFETGVTQTYNFAVSGSNDEGDFRISFTNLDQKGFVPNTDLRRNTIALSGAYRLSDKLTANAVVNYIQGESGNRPNLSYGTENIMYLFNCWFPRNNNIESFKDYWQAGREGLNQFNYNYNYHDNPYFNLYENTNGQEINRTYGNVSLQYRFNPMLSLQLRGGTDFGSEFRDRRRAYSTQRFPLGSYREEFIQTAETNLDFLLSFTKSLSADFNLDLSLGGNHMFRTYRNSDMMAPELAVPGIYSLSNSRVALLASAFRSEKEINSLYGTAQLGFRNWLYLDLSARNDWSSTLPSKSRSYLYYASNLGIVLSDLLEFDPSSAISFAKFRIGLAQVGNDTDPYQLQAVYSAQTPVQGLPSFLEPSSLVNADLKPEISTSFEAGLDLRFFQNRIGLDATYYRTRSSNQILPIPLSGTTGYSSRLINAGLIQNQGLELMLNFVPVRTNNFEWNISLNGSTNRGKVLELYTDPVSGQEITTYVMASRYVTVLANVGGNMGDIYGIGFERVSSDPSSPYYDPTGKYVGQIVFNNVGKPLATTTQIKLGNYNPDFLAGLQNNFSFKGIQLGILFDIRSGGEIYSHTQTVGREGGIIAETLEGRENGYYANSSDPLMLNAPAGTYVVGEGVVRNADGSFSPNTRRLTAREWHTSITLGRRLVEGMVYDASFVKLRELRLGFNVPSKMLGKLPVRDLSFSVVGRNLALWTDVPHVDPETASTSGGTIIPGVESVALPSTRSIGFNLNFKF